MSAEASLASVSQRDIDIDAVFTIETMPTSGTGARLGIQVRKTAASYYRPTIRLSPGGAASVGVDFVNATNDAQNRIIDATTLSDKLTTGTRYHFQVQAFGTSPTTLRARVFKDGQTAPAWQVSTSDSAITNAGALAFYGYAASNSTPSAFRISTFTAKQLVTAGDQTPAPAPTPSASRGSLPLGSTNYPIPSDSSKVITVDPASGNALDDVTPSDYLFDRTHTKYNCNRKPNATAFPLKNRTVASLARAIKWVPDGGTIVMKSGVYHEQLTVCESKKFTIQAAPGATVWLDGSSTVTGWRQDGNRWVRDNWTAQFDSSPTQEWGAPDNNAQYWNNITAEHPLAAHPDQVFVDGKPQTQVASANAVTPGSFYVDYAAKRLYLGSNPAGHEVRASDLQFALRFATAGNTVRGIGVRHYATSVPQMAAIVTEPSATNMLFENDIVRNNAVGGIHLAGNTSTMRNVTLNDNGMIGGSAYAVNGLTIDKSVINGNNAEHFKQGPMSAGFKTSTSQNVTITKSLFSGNDANGIWIDDSARNFDIISNDVLNNGSSGIVTEISYNGRIVNNVVQNNGNVGVLIFGTENDQLMNNTITGSRHVLMVYQDNRINPATKTPWSTKNTRIRNNIIGNTNMALAPYCAQVCVYDNSKVKTAAQMVPDLNGNVYQRPDAKSPVNLFRWPLVAANNANSYTSLAAFRAATGGLDPSGLEIVGALPVKSDGTASADLAAQVAKGTVGTPIEAAIASLMGVTSGARVVGAVR